MRFYDEELDKRHMGTVTKFFEDRGFGFVRCHDDNQTYFAHISNVADGVLYPKSLVEFCIGANKKSGKPEAYSIMTVEVPEIIHN